MTARPMREEAWLALAPFAAAAVEIDDDLPDEHAIVRSEYGFVLTAGDFRRAREARGTLVTTTEEE